MTNIPSNLARVPNSLVSQIVTGSLQRAQRGLLETQIQLATGQRVNRPSDDALATSAVSVLDDVLERRDQRLRNLSHAEGALNTLDAALAEATDLVIEAKGVASAQIGAASDAETRRNQAIVVDALLNEMVSVANRQFQDLFLFGGDATAEQPMVERLGAFRYQGVGAGMTTDLGLGSAIPVTASAERAFGALSSRVEGNFDLDPMMVADTRLSDLNGARGLGVTTGEINVDVGGTVLAVDLSTAHTVGDVVAALEAQIQSVDGGATVAIAASGDALRITPSAGVTVTISDPTGGVTAQDLGLDGAFAGPGGGTGGDVDPRLTAQTSLAALGGVSFPLGTIRLENAGQSRDLDLSGATTVQDLMNLVEELDLGVRVEIADGGDRLNFVNELSGGRLAIAEAGGTTATELGVRSLAPWTRLEDFNEGRGVRIVSGSVDPVTGNPDPSADLDFRVTTKDGSSFDVDLAGAETVQDVVDAINAAAAVGGLAVTAGLAVNGNGFRLSDSTAGSGTTTVTALNGSFAAEDIGLAGSSTGPNLVGEDRAKVAVDSIFTHLIDLRDALLTDDEAGITLAASKFDADVSLLAEARADVGVRSRRVADASTREEDLRIQDMALRSQVRDLDFTEASIRLATLQQQLQAGLLTARQATSLSLLDFLT